MSTSTHDLGPFLKAWAARAPKSGDADCGMFIADWVRAVTGKDPCPALRGAYDSHESGIALLGDAGLFQAVGRLARRAGLKAIPEPLAGCIGVIEKDKIVFLGIYGGKFWHTYFGGVMGLKGVKVIRAWRFDF